MAKRLGIAPITLRSILAEHGDVIPSLGTPPRLRFTKEGLEKIRELRSVRKVPRGRAAAKAKAAAAAAAAAPGVEARRRPRREAATGGAETPKRRGSGSRVVSHRVAEERAGTARRRVKAVAEEAPASVPAVPAGLSLKDIERATQISYPTLMRYAKDHADQLPSVVVGSRRFYAPSAIDVVLQLRARSKAGRKPGPRRAAAAAAVRGVAVPVVATAPVGSDVATVLAAIEARLAAIEAELRKPVSLSLVRS